MDKLEQLSGGRLNERQTKLVIDGLLGENDKLFGRIAHRYSQFYSDGPFHDKEEALQIVRQIAWEELTKIGKGEGRGDLAWEAVVNVRSRTALRDYVTSSASTGIPGSGSTIRRQQALAKHSDSVMETTGKSLEGTELLDDYNEANANVPNAVKRGVFATYADLQPPALALTELFPERTHLGTESIEMLDVIRSVLEICKEDEDTDLILVAELWLGWYPDGEAMTYANIALTCKLSPTKVSRLVETTRQIFQSQF